MLLGISTEASSSKAWAPPPNLIPALLLWVPDGDRAGGMSPRVGICQILGMRRGLGVWGAAPDTEEFGGAVPDPGTSLGGSGSQIFFQLSVSQKVGRPFVST